MEKKSYIEINPEQVQAFMQTPHDEPVVMLNLLKFKDRVAETNLSGEASYKEYMKQATPFFNKANAEILFYGQPKHMLIGPEDDVLWDRMLVVKYKTMIDFVHMIRDKAYPLKLRAQSLTDSRLIHCE